MGRLTPQDRTPQASPAAALAHMGFGRVQEETDEDEEVLAVNGCADACTDPAKGLRAVLAVFKRHDTEGRGFLREGVLIGTLRSLGMPSAEVQACIEAVRSPGADGVAYEVLIRWAFRCGDCRDAS